MVNCNGSYIAPLPNNDVIITQTKRSLLKILSWTYDSWLLVYTVSGVVLFVFSIVFIVCQIIESDNTSSDVT